MKFIYGKQDFTTLARGQENCYLLTNGLGGFSSATIIGSNSRNDHAFLMGCTEAPNHRYNLIHRLEECLERDDACICLSSQEYADSGQNERGYRNLSSFTFEDYPQWTYDVDGVTIVKEMAMKQGANLVAVRYEIENRTQNDVTFCVTPHLQFVPKGTQMAREKRFEMTPDSISSDGIQVYFKTNGKLRQIPPRVIENLYYAYDACDGRPAYGRTYVNHRIEKRVRAGKAGKLEIIYSMEGIETNAASVLKEAKAYREGLADASHLRHEMARMLAKSANQFVARRDSTGGKTMLAGYPFFEDWGRDTMIAIAGCCITTGQTKTAKSILRTFAAYCKNGLMPNLFPEGGNAPQYNTADAALLFINAVYLYFEKTKDLSFVGEMWGVMREIISYYKEGTLYGIHMDEDGLILAGGNLDQVTWMDVRVGQILPTPRHGKPVEINAYWYNALCIMEQFGPLLGERTEYKVLAAQVKESFREKFWNPAARCLKDVISGTAADEQIRCNQIWAVSMPFSALDEEQARQVVDTVFEKLYTPCGLRTLEKSDPQFCKAYKGEQIKRDLAYHQGTVWVFPLGAYYLAYLKTHGYSREAREEVERRLESMECALREGCVGQLPEIYDGEVPGFSRGCFAQAWSVGEILRVYEAMERYEV
ncbi:amylo-alpha-1,6-glucosidase [Roseburia hominis]